VRPNWPSKVSGASLFLLPVLPASHLPPVVTRHVFAVAATLAVLGTLGHAYLIWLSDPVYEPAPVEIMRRRKEWFERLSQVAVVLWWVPRGHRPSVTEAPARPAPRPAGRSGTDCPAA
jgi:hypothetical protein